jgi:hypothetical protein
MTLLSNTHRFVKIAAVANEIYGQAKGGFLDWQAAYELIFSADISTAIQATGFTIEWCDPDMDYEDDVRAYMEAVNEKAKQYRDLLDKIGAT